MKKETLIAVVFGVLLGIVAAVIMIGKAKQIGMNKTASNTIKSTTATTSGQLSKIQLLEISEPANRSLSAKNNITIKGKASKNGLIVIQSAIKELAMKNETEAFSINFPISLGENIISISLYPKDPQVPPQQKTLKIYFIGEK